MWKCILYILGSTMFYILDGMVTYILNTKTMLFCPGAKIPEYEKFQWLPVDHLCIIVYLVGCQAVKLNGEFGKYNGKVNKDVLINNSIFTRRQRRL